MTVRVLPDQKIMSFLSLAQDLTWVHVSVATMTNWFIPFIYGALGALPALLVLFADWDKSADKLKTVGKRKERTVYDFVIVGAGSAGAVLANRLSVHFNVLLLERGGDPNPLSAVPELATILLNYPQTDYMYRTVPQRSSCLSLNNRESSWSRGKGLGGSSNLNLMVYLRGHPLDYDNWARQTGDSRWNYSNLLPYFLKSEDYCFACEENLNGDSVIPQFHRRGGPLTVGKPRFNPLVPEFLDAAAWGGIPRVDLNAPYIQGAAGVSYTQRKGRRWSTYRAFLKPILNRKRLTIHRHSRVIKIIFRDSSYNEAYGVEYIRHGRRQVAFATKEVILSAGAIDSAKLLMLSGIGPQDHLQSLGIPVRVNLPVGRNLQDHIGTFPGPFLINQPKSFVAERDVDPHEVANFVFHGNGTLSTTLINAVAFFPSTHAVRDGQGDWPDTEWMFLGVGNHQTIAQDLSHGFNLRYDVMSKFLDPIKGKDAFQITVMLSRPKVRGVLLLRSADYRDDPVMDPRYFEDEDGDDIKVMVEGVKRAVYVAENAPSFKQLGSRLSPVPFPPCAYLLFRSDPYWECFTRHYSVSIFHYSGTTAMGPVDSPESVVDSELRVIGTKRLRVIDAGIMPTVVTVNTNGPTIMIGERGADFVLDTWKPYVQPYYNYQ